MGIDLTDEMTEAFSALTMYSTKIESILYGLLKNGGVLTAEKVNIICEDLSVNVEQLMVMLLPLAESFAIAPISLFSVGAVVQGLKDKKFNQTSLYLGANFEYKNLSLNFSIHAEQAAVSNAWLNGEVGISSIATSAAPCGHCRQFLYEISSTNNLPVIMPSQSSNEILTVDIQTLLPSAFGPIQLDCEFLLMQKIKCAEQLSIISSSDDELINITVEQAKLSYAPYTQNFSACTIELNDGSLFYGRYAENAAHNPSLSAFSSAVSQVAMSPWKEQFRSEIRRVILVEKKTLASQKKYAELLLSNLNKNIKLEYFNASLPV